MSGIGDFFNSLVSGGGAGGGIWSEPSDSQTWGTGGAVQWLQWLTGNPNPANVTGVGGFDVANQMIAATREEGGSPYAGATAYDPGGDITNIQSAITDLQAAISGLPDTSSIMSSAKSSADAFLSTPSFIGGTRPLTDTNVTSAVAKVETFFGLSTISSLMLAFEAGERLTFNREIGRLSVSLHDLRRSMTSSWDTTMAMAGQAFYDRIAAKRVELMGVYANLVEKFTAMYNNRTIMEEQFDVQWQQLEEHSVVQVAALYCQRTMELVEAARAKAVAAMDAAKFIITANDDANRINLSYETQDALWNLNLFSFGGNVLASISGAAVLPKMQTNGERLLANLTTSLSTGMQLTGMTGNPIIGAAAGVGTFALQQWLGGK